MGLGLRVSWEVHGTEYLVLTGTIPLLTIVVTPVSPSMGGKRGSCSTSMSIFSRGGPLKSLHATFISGLLFVRTSATDVGDPAKVEFRLRVQTVLGELLGLSSLLWGALGMGILPDLRGRA